MKKSLIIIILGIFAFNNANAQERTQTTIKLKNESNRSVESHESYHLLSLDSTSQSRNRISINGVDSLKQK